MQLEKRIKSSKVKYSAFLFARLTKLLFLLKKGSLGEIFSVAARRDCLNNLKATELS